MALPSKTKHKKEKKIKKVPVGAAIGGTLKNQWMISRFSKNFKIYWYSSLLSPGGCPS